MPENLFVYSLRSGLQFFFYPRDAMLAQHYASGVCLSVRLSITSQISIERAGRIELRLYTVL